MGQNGGMPSRWTEVGAGVFVRRFRTWGGFRFDQNVGLVIGTRGALVVDTRGSHRKADRLIREIRSVTSAPTVAVVNTHHHWDHTFGNARFVPAPIWGHENCAASFEARSAERRNLIIRHEPSIASELGEVEFTPPTRTFRRRATIDLGDRVVLLAHLGLGHTDNDIVVQVPDASVVFAGDLVASDNPLGFGDSYPASWVRVAKRVAEMTSGGVLVPGHGYPVDAAYVRDLRDQLHTLVNLGRLAMDGALGEKELIRRSPFRAEATRLAFDRLKLELG
jgi:glyoxylase-like metal-dependent hydrolase (beta-lactamase superfamily II)